MIIQGDVLTVLGDILANTINCIVTSPPYFGLRNYDLPPTNWPEVSYSPMAGLPELTIPAMSCCLGLEDTIEAYVGHMVLIWRGLWRVLRDDGNCWLNLGDSYASSPVGSNPGIQEKAYYNAGSGKFDKLKLGLKPKNLLGIPWRVAFALQADGWYLRSDIIWDKKNPMPESVTDRPTKAHEYVFLLAKSGAYWYDQEAIREPHTKPWEGTKRGNYTNGTTTGYDIKTNSRQKFSFGGLTQSTSGRNRRTVWTIATKPFKAAHFAVMPPKLVEPCIKAGCPSRVCVECGKPWVRVVEKEKGDTESSKRPKGKGQAGYGTPSSTLSLSGGSVGWAKRGSKIKTTAFAPTCDCSAPHQPGVVLDPFFGAGTVGVVATQLGYRWRGIELNQEYAKMAQERLTKTQPALMIM